MDAHAMSGRSEALRSVDDLVAARLVDPMGVPGLIEAANRYPVAISPTMADLIERGQADDPIARQFVPDARELVVSEGEAADPIGDEVHSPVPGIVHRYPDRALLKVTHLCPVYCRFCFRRETVGPGKSEALSDAELDRALDYIAASPVLWEVIVTGGDPLMLSPRRLHRIAERLSAIEHLRIVRWHTRVPVVDPGRVNDELVAALLAARKVTYVGVHANHPRELTASAGVALARLADAGVALVSQTVLLRGINDNAAVLADLMRAFVECRVQPYYLHHLDPAPGTSHFRVPIEEGQALMRALRGRISGLAQPTYVIDIPGGHGKVPIGPGYFDGRDGIEDPWGGRHRLAKI
jgi:lysine 2,3-aminomutase